MNVDGTDFKIAEQGPSFSSHKYAKKSALRYEVATCIQTGAIVWVNGPFEAGMWPDISIFRCALKSMLAQRERVEADDGYIGEAPLHVKCPKMFADQTETERMQSIVRQRHETVNKRFKQFGVLRDRYRHDLRKHGDVFRAVAVLTQLALDNGEPLFSVDYVDPSSSDQGGDASSSDSFWGEDSDSGWGSN